MQNHPSGWKNTKPIQSMVSLPSSRNANEMVALGDVKQVDLDRILRQDLMREAFQELSAREDVKPELERAREVVKRIGY